MSQSISKGKQYFFYMSFLEWDLAFCNHEALTEHDVYLMQGLSKSLLYFCLQSTIALLIIILEIHTSLE